MRLMKSWRKFFFALFSSSSLIFATTVGKIQVMSDIFLRRMQFFSVFSFPSLLSSYFTWDYSKMRGVLEGRMLYILGD